MSETIEFSRRYSLAEIGGTPRAVEIEADEAERAALARRFALVSLDGLAAQARLRAVAEGIEAEGTVRARVVQSCVATGAPLPAQLDEPFHILFVPEAAETADEVELDATALDSVTHDGLAIDLGEAVAQTLGLALDPFPRAAGADEALKAAGVLQEGETGPFAKLKGLFDKPRD